MNNDNDQATGALTLWSGVNYGAPGLPVTDGQAGILAADVGVWSYQSVGIENMQLFVWTAPDTATPGYSFVGHVENLLSTNETNLPSLYAGAAYPLQFIGIDPLQVGVLMINVESSDAPMALAPAQSYPGSGVPVTTFAAQNISGMLGFVSRQAGSSTAVSIQYGDYSTSTGSVTWTGSGSLAVTWNGGAPVIGELSGLPASWSFGTPVLQGDGSWSVTLNVGAADNSGALYTGTNFTGSSKPLSPQVLTQLNSGIGWIYNSLKLFNMPALIYSSFAPTNANYVYTNYQELLLTNNTSNFAASFTGTAPVSLLSLDNSDVTVNVVVNTIAADEGALIMTQTYPQMFYTFASTARSGLLAVIPQSGAVQTLNVSYGSLDASGHFSATGSGSLAIAMNAGVPVITPDMNIPANWTFSSPEQQPDGSWRVALNDQPVMSSLSLYPQINYGGTAVPLAEHQSVTLRTLANLWQYDSVQVNGLRWLSATMFTPSSTTYDYRKYRDSYSTSDVADISQDYVFASPLISGIALGPNDVVVRVKLMPQDTSQRIVMNATQSWPTQLNTASIYLGDISTEGVLIVFDKTQPLRTIPIQLGVLTADGAAIWQMSTTVTALWDDNLQKPVLVLASDAPEDCLLSSVQPTGNQGEFTTSLTFNNRLHVAMYPITNAPYMNALGKDETYGTYNKVVLYCEHAITVNISLTGNAKFKSNDQHTCTVDLPALTMTTIEFYCATQESVTVTLSGEHVDTQNVMVDFAKFDFERHLRLAANSGAPATGMEKNSVYFDTSGINKDHVTVTLSGNAVFAGTHSNQQQIALSSGSYDCTFNIVNLMAETITVKAEVLGFSPISTTMTFVESNI